MNRLDRLGWLSIHCFYSCTYMGSKKSCSNLKGVFALILSCGSGFFKDLHCISVVAFSFSGPSVETRGRQLKPAEIQPAPASFCKAPGPSLELGMVHVLSSGIRSLPALYTSPLMLSWSQAMVLLFPFSETLFLGPTLFSESLACYIAALFATAFSFLFTIHCPERW